MKKRIVIWLIIALLVGMIPAAAASEAGDVSITNGCHTVDGQIPVLGTQRLVDNGKSFIVYEAVTDTLMYADNADEKLPPASLLKILTALIAIEKRDLADAITVKKEVLATLDYDAVVVEPSLKVGEVLTLKDLLYCMMVASGNDAAVVLADYAMGSQEAFVEEMNRYAKELGCTNTNFTNVHGLHDDNQYTTARDIARILAKAIQNEQFCEIFNAKKYTVPATNKTESRNLFTQNFLLSKEKDVNYYDERVSGSRTAVANDNTRSIASVAEKNGMKMICVVMGAASVYESDGYTPKVYGGYKETSQLFDLSLNGYKPVQLLGSGQVYKQVAVTDGSSDATVATKNAAYAVVPETVTQADLEYKIVNETTLVAPVSKGRQVSTLQIWYNGICLAQEDLFTTSTVLPAGKVFDTVELIEDPVDNGGALRYILGIGLGVVGLLAVGVALLLSKRKRHSRNYRRRV